MADTGMGDFEQDLRTGRLRRRHLEFLQGLAGLDDGPGAHGFLLTDQSGPHGTAAGDAGQAGCGGHPARIPADVPLALDLPRIAACAAGKSPMAVGEEAKMSAPWPVSSR
ncbi:hypothetical protein GCM10011504_42140 [Siccirubricoccus deserti]|nr:hypothetical protein GCM10011504_42140 [Siccirubricoccus deserti]